MEDGTNSVDVLPRHAMPVPKPLNKRSTVPRRFDPPNLLPLPLRCAFINSGGGGGGGLVCGDVPNTRGDDADESDEGNNGGGVPGAPTNATDLDGLDVITVFKIVCSWLCKRFLSFVCTATAPATAASGSVEGWRGRICS